MFQPLTEFQQGGTLYDYLKSTGRKGSAAYNKGRKELAAKAGIKNYSGTKEQNIELLNFLQSTDNPVVGHKTPSLQRFLTDTPNTVTALPGTQFSQPPVDPNSTFDVIPQSNLSFLQPKVPTPPVDMSFLNNYGKGFKAYQQGGVFVPAQQGPKGNTDYDSIADYLYYSKAAKDGNRDGMNNSIKHIAQVRGTQTATDMQFLGKDLKYASLNDVAKRNISHTTNPQMQKFYHMVNENPDLMNHFSMNMPQNRDVAREQDGGNFNPVAPKIKKRGGFIKSKVKNPYN